MSCATTAAATDARPYRPGPYRIDDLGARRDRAARPLGLERVSFCGLSIGGMVGMWLASEAPERIDRLVLCCTRAVSPACGAVARARRGGARRRSRSRGRRRARALVHAGVPRPSIPTWSSASARCSSRRPPRATPPAARRSRRLDLRARLASITAPTLVITGARGPVAPPDAGAAARRRRSRGAPRRRRAGGAHRQHRAAPRRSTER